MLEFNQILGCLADFHKISLYQFFTEVRSLGVSLVHSDGQTDG